MASKHTGLLISYAAENNQLKIVIEPCDPDLDYPGGLEGNLTEVTVSGVDQFIDEPMLQENLGDLVFFEVQDMNQVHICFSNLSEQQHTIGCIPTAEGESLRNNLLHREQDPVRSCSYCLH